MSTIPKRSRNCDNDLIICRAVTVRIKINVKRQILPQLSDANLKWQMQSSNKNIE